MRGHLVVVILALSVASQTVWAQDLGTCLISLIKSLEDGVGKCTAWKDYVNCNMWGTNADTTFTTDAEIQVLQTTVQNRMYKQGVYCYINVRDILSNIKQERRNGVTRTTARPIGFNEPASAAECSYAMGTAVGENGVMSCDIFASFMKCLFRVENWYYRPSHYTYKKLNDFMENVMSELKILCVVDARELIEEVARENGYTTVITKTTTTGKTKSHESIGRDIYLTNAAPSFDSRYESARTIDDCQTISNELEQEVGAGSCSVWRSALKCLIRVTGIFEVTNGYAQSRLQSVVDSGSTYGRHCTEDMVVLFEEVRQEQGFNYGKGFTSGAKSWANAVITFSWIVSVIVSLFLGAGQKEF